MVRVNRPTTWKDTTESCGRKYNNIAGIENRLLEATMTVMRNELRIWLLRSLLERNLATRDIFHFAKNQGMLRQYNKIPDRRTIEIAMKVKIEDLRMVLLNSYKNKRKKKKDLLVELNHRTFKLRKKTVKINKLVQYEQNKIKISYEKKIQHYLNCQTERNNNLDMNSRGDFCPTKTPKKLMKYRNLPIFGKPSDLPEPEQTLGPYICDPDIVITEEERCILSKDPKFCISFNPDLMNFRTEVERSLAKHRYNEWDKKNKRKKKLKLNSCIEGKKEEEKKKDSKSGRSDTVRLDRLNKLFDEDNECYFSVRIKIIFSKS